MFKRIFALCLYMILGSLIAPLLDAQTHTSIPLESHVYYILEQAEIRGLITPLPGTRPYIRSVVVRKINEILNNDDTGRLASARISDKEKTILNQYLESFAKPDPGLNWKKGMLSMETEAGADNVSFSANIGLTGDIGGSLNLSAEDFYYGAEIWLGGFINGDLGKSFSYEFSFMGGLVRAPRLELGEYNTYYEGFTAQEGWSPDEFIDEKIKVHSEPLTHFPFSYRKRWDGSVFHFAALSDFSDWPEEIAGAYSLPAELTASFIEDKLIMRAGRISREWGSTSFGSSLFLNQTARPFMALEADFNPVSWFGISSMTGALEYYNQDGIKISSSVFQNLFSITMLQLRIKNYLFLELTDGVVYPKRFEPGYVAPIINSFFYQNNIGDFDNMAMTLSARAQYPGIGSVWFSLFLDEMSLLSDLFTLDRQMVAMQAGITLPLPIFSFSSLKVSYTRINPYCYTHNRNKNPWYGDLRMETAYTNNGKNLGYYLPPNSDELLVRFETMPSRNLNLNLQYQMIRHGADYGSSAVDGSHIRSELDPSGRSENPILYRFFLQDGAYQWFNIIKAGIDWNLSKLPIALFCEAGAVISFFTNIDDTANSGAASGYSRINTPEYPESTAGIARLGVRIFPRW